MLPDLPPGFISGKSLFRLYHSDRSPDGISSKSLFCLFLFDISPISISGKALFRIFLSRLSDLLRIRPSLSFFLLSSGKPSLSFAALQDFSILLVFGSRQIISGEADRFCPPEGDLCRREDPPLDKDPDRFLPLDLDLEGRRRLSFDLDLVRLLPFDLDLDLLFSSGILFSLFKRSLLQRKQR